MPDVKSAICAAVILLLPQVTLAQSTSTSGSSNAMAGQMAPAGQTESGQKSTGAPMNDNMSSPAKTPAQKLRTAVPGTVGSGVATKQTPGTSTVAPQ